jgi:hypothetical protein
MPHRDFDAARAERERQVEPVTFTLGGEQFQCVLAPSVGDALDLADAPEPETSLIGSVRAIVRFVDKILVPADRARFAELIRKMDTPHGPVNAYDLIEVGVWLGEEYAGRPTDPSSDSSGGRDQTTTGSTSNSESSSEPAEASPNSG